MSERFLAKIDHEGAWHESFDVRQSTCYAMTQGECLDALAVNSSKMIRFLKMKTS